MIGNSHISCLFDWNPEAGQSTLNWLSYSRYTLTVNCIVIIIIIIYTYEIKIIRKKWWFHVQDLFRGPNLKSARIQNAKKGSNIQMNPAPGISL